MKISSILQVCGWALHSVRVIESIVSKTLLSWNLTLTPNSDPKMSFFSFLILVILGQMSKPLWLSTPRLLWPYNFLPYISILRGQNHENIMHENVLNQELQFEALPCLGSKSWWKLSPYFSKKWWFVLFNFLIQCTIWSQIAIPCCTIISHVNFSRFGPLQIKISDKNLSGHNPLGIVYHIGFNTSKHWLLA